PHKPWAPMPITELRLPRSDPYDSSTREEKDLEREINRTVDEALVLMWSGLAGKGELTPEHQRVFAISFKVSEALRKKEYGKAKDLADQALIGARKLA
ncbi:MAG: hypothetical protein ACETV1_04730, partial [Candidatus Bathyarchaeia archaeon]